MNEKKLKKILKSIKLNETSISFVLGLIVVFVVGLLFVNYLRKDRSNIPSELLSGTSTVEGSEKKHIVKKGDNLWNIAVAYYGDGFKWVDIATENRLSNASIIEEGQELILPNLEGDETYTELTDNDQPENSTDENTHVVQKGESLWSIAVNEYGDGYRWTEIAKLNNLTHPNLIHSGNVLKLP